MKNTLIVKKGKKQKERKGRERDRLFISLIYIEIKELERVEVQLEGTRGLAPLSTYTGFLVIDDYFRSIPIGSTLDTKQGIFYLQLGPGFYGTYEFVFLKADGIDRRKVRVRDKILPKYSGPLE